MSTYEIEYGKYCNNRVAVQVYDDEGPFATLSVNVPEIKLEQNEFILSHNLMSPIFEKFLTEMLDTGKFEDTGKRCSYGFCKNVPIWRIVLPS